MESRYSIMNPIRERGSYMTEDRKAAARRRREQQVKKQKMILAISIVCLLILLWICISSSCGKKEDEAVEAGQVKQSAEVGTKAHKEDEGSEADTEDRLNKVREEAKAAGYPEGVLELLSKNPETIEFVENYGEKKDSSFATEIEELVKGEIPRLLQWDERWGYAPYGTSIVAVSGCGPTCLSMVISGLTGDASLTPAKMAEYGTEHHYINEDNDTYWIFMSEASANWNVHCEEKRLEEDALIEELQKGHPVICSVGPGDFTQNGHFIVLAGYENGKIIVHDPFSAKNSDKRWEFSKFEDQIKAMWIYSIDS